MNADTNINDNLRLAASICGMQIQPLAFSLLLKL